MITVNLIKDIYLLSALYKSNYLIISSFSFLFYLLTIGEN